MRKFNCINVIFLILLSGMILVFISCKDDDEDTDTPPVSSTLFSDDFDQDDLNDGWAWTNEPDDWDINTTRMDYLHFKGIFNANIWCEDHTSCLFQLVSEDQDFDISTHMRCIWGQNASDVAGIIVKSATSGEWVLLKFWMHGNASGRLEFQTQCNDIISPVPGSEKEGGDADIFLRIKKAGADYSTYFKINEGDDWIFIGTTQFDDQIPLQVGLFGGVDSGDGELIIEFDYFRVE